MKTFITLLFIFCIWIGVWYLFFQRQQETFIIQSVHTTVVTQLEKIQDLWTAKMHLQKVVQWEKEMSDLIPGRNIDNTIGKFLFEDNILMTIDAEVVAGIDIQKLTQSGIVVHPDSSVSIHIPAAQILYTNLTDDTQLNTRETGILTKWDPQMETKLRNAVKKDMESAAIEKWILLEAEKNALTTIQSLLESSGIHIQEITIEQKDIG